MPIRVFDPRRAEENLICPNEVAWRLEAEIIPWDDLSAEEVWEAFIRYVDVSKVYALSLGYGFYFPDDLRGIGPDGVAELLSGHADRLPNLRALYLADVEPALAELSWIEQGNISPILSAFPRLQELGVRGAAGLEAIDNRGGSSLKITPIRHDGLKVLRLENGGMPREVLDGLFRCEFPNLNYLDLWMGSEFYGRTATEVDLEPLLNGTAFPSLRHMGILNSDKQDDIAKAVSSSAVVARLDSLGLGLGNLSDEGAFSLLSGQPLAHLREIDLRHHFLSASMMCRLREALEPFGVSVNLDERQSEDPKWPGRYISASE